MWCFALCVPRTADPSCPCPRRHHCYHGHLVRGSTRRSSLDSAPWTAHTPGHLPGCLPASGGPAPAVSAIWVGRGMRLGCAGRWWATLKVTRRVLTGQHGLVNITTWFVTSTRSPSRPRGCISWELGRPMGHKPCVLAAQGTTSELKRASPELNASQIMKIAKEIMLLESC